MARRPTISDVAAASGFSPTMVSHALSGKRELNPETVRRIREAAGRLGYAPSRSASALRLGRTGTIGLLSPAVGERPADDELLGLGFYMRLSAEIARRAFERGHSVLLLPHSRDRTRLAHAEIDGALLSDPERDDPVLAALREIDVPVVTLESDPDRPADAWQVRADHALGTAAVLDHFHAEGARRPALLIPAVGWAWPAQVRAAFESWCAERSLEPWVETVPAGDAERATREMLARPQPPDALLALTEGFGPAALRAAADLGVAVPGKLLLACGADSPRAAAAEVPLTAVALSPERQGRAAVDLLLERLDGDAGRGPVVIEPELVVRRSSNRFESDRSRR